MNNTFSNKDDTVT